MTDPALSPWIAVFTIVGLWAVLVVTPGPNFLATVHVAATRSRREALMVVAGLALGTFIWATASLAGLGLMFQSAAWLYHTVRIIGAIYLIFIGVSLLRSAARRSPASVAGLSLAKGFRSAFKLGLITALSNPKAAAFFTSLFAVTMPLEAPFWLQAVAVGIVVAMGMAWYGLVALAMRSAPFRTLYRRGQRAITALSGALFAAFGIRLASNG